MPYQYSILRLNFKTAVRFGNGKGAAGLDAGKISLPSDSLFSAVFTEYIRFFGEEEADKLVASFEKAETAISSLFPWKRTDKGFSYYIPRPIFPGVKRNSEDNVKKQLKKIKYISLSNLKKYIDFINGKTDLGEESEWDLNIGSEMVTDRVNLTGEKPEPYRVTSYRFVEGSGLYFVIRYTDKALFENFIKAVELLGISGIGGKVSSGLGKYTLDIDNMEGQGEEKLLYDMMEDKNAKVQMLIGAYHPKEEEIEKLKQEGYTYILEKRDGFCTSPYFSNANGPLKRKSCIMVAEGSCFAERLEGQILDLSYGNFHKVYRLGKTLFVGVAV